MHVSKDSMWREIWKILQIFLGTKRDLSTWSIRETGCSAMRWPFCIIIVLTCGTHTYALLLHYASRELTRATYVRTLACMQIDQSLASSVGVYNTTVCMVAVRCRDGINPSFNLLIDSRQACGVGSKISGIYISMILGKGGPI
jgi:hypothetical protein